MGAVAVPSLEGQTGPEKTRQSSFAREGRRQGRAVGLCVIPCTGDPNDCI